MGRRGGKCGRSEGGGFDSGGARVGWLSEDGWREDVGMIGE